MDIQTQIKTIQLEKGWTNQEFADKLKLKRANYLSGIKSGKRNLSMPLLRKIEKISGKKLVIKFE